MSQYISPDSLTFQQRLVQQMVDHFMDEGDSVSVAVARTQHNLIESCSINWEKLHIDGTTGAVGIFTTIAGRRLRIERGHQAVAAPEMNRTRNRVREPSEEF